MVGWQEQYWKAAGGSRGAEAALSQSLSLQAKALPPGCVLDESLQPLPAMG